MSARLVEQKGLDLILGTDALLDLDAQFVFLGRGEPRYEQALSTLARRAADRVAVPLSFSERAEHRLLAGADILLMPSLYEPCGLTQMRAQRYGALPVGRRVGGLNDTIADGVSGFLFDEYRPEPFFAALWRAISCYYERAVWNDIVRNAMRIDHSWGPSAKRYQTLYQRACARRTAGA
jgi:starch synthase